MVYNKFTVGLTWCLGVMLAILLTGCASNKTPDVLDFGIGPANADGQRDIPHVVWPAQESGEPPRYLYAGELTGEQNFRAAKKTGKTFGESMVAAFRWLVGLVGGEAQPVVLQRPQSGAVDKAGQRILVSDTSRQAVYVFNQKEGRLDVWENASKMDRFVGPAGIAIGATSDVYVADTELGYVARLDTKGHSLGSIGKEVLKRPLGVAFDADTQQLYVADTYGHDIKVFDAQGRLLRTLGKRGEAPGEFNFPTYLAWAHGELYVTDTMNARIQILDGLTGEAKLTIGERGLNIGDLVRPKGVAVDIEGNIYIMESYHDYLLVYNRKGEFLMPVGGTGEGIGQFYLPTSVWADSDNRIFIADMFNARIVLLQYLSKALPRE